MKKQIIVLMVLASVFYAFGGKIQDQAYTLLLKGLLAHSVPELSVSDLQTVESEVALLDARAREEYEVSHLEDALYVGYKAFNIATIQHIPKETPIVVYCSIGYRSEKIAEKLIENGYSEVHNLFGGLFEWKNRGLAVYDKQGITERVHGFDRIWGIWLRKGEKVYE